MERKKFNDWLKLKESLHFHGRKPNIKEGEIWWCSVGENIGKEINGKGKVFSRPVLIYKKLSRYNFLGIPLTSKIHQGSWYVSFIFHDKTSVATLAQIRSFDTSRLLNKMGTISDLDFGSIKHGFHKLYF